MKPLNILYLHSHDTGRYIQPYGHPVATPHLQALAEEGVLFRRAYCVNPTCSPSRAALLTGQYAHSCGMFGLVNLGFEMPDYRKHLVQVLRRAGYHTTLSGIQHEAKESETVGYHQFLGRGDDSHTRAVDFLADAPEEPFFLAVGLFETHRSFPELNEDDRPDYTMPPASFPDTQETRQDFCRFQKSATIMDRKMGTVLDALDANGLAENTLVICTTDHGIAFPRMKCNLTEGGLGVMLIMRGPEGFRGGRVIDAMVSHLDIVPTICELAGLEPEHELQGTSLMPLIRGDTEHLHDRLYGEVNFHATYEPMRCVRSNRWTYIRRFYRDALPSCDPGETRELWLEGGWDDCALPDEMLYDRLLDPGEMHNLAADPTYEPLLDSLRRDLHEWMETTHDPLLRGPLSPPDGHSLRELPVCRSDAKLPQTPDP